MAAEVDPDLAILIAARLPQDRSVAATVVFHDSIYGFEAPTDSDLVHFERVLDDLIARVTEYTDREPDWVYPSPAKKGCELFGPARFVVELVQEPGVARAFKGFVLSELDDIGPPPVRAEAAAS
jgi:hypothetical protein